MKTFTTTLANLDRFAYIGGFSVGVYAGPAAFNKKVKVLFLGIGSVEGPGLNDVAPRLFQ